jgi:hypothetical protein
MNRVLTTFAAALLIGGSTLIGCKKNETASTDNRTAGEKTREAVTNAGEKTGNAVGNAVDKTTDATKSAGNKMAASTQPSADTAMKGTRDTLASAVEDALTHNDFDKLVGEFTKVDRDRIGKVDKNSLADLNQLIGQFRNDWKAKYNQDFKLSDKDQVVFGTPVAIQVGEAAEARLASSSTPPANTADNGKNAANNVTTATFPAVGSSAPAVSVTLRNEGTTMKDYKIDVPDTLDASKLKSNLMTHIQHIESMKDQWPSDVNEAGRIVSQHILAAITDTKTTP